MSERILKALMQLFALVADVDGVSNPSRKIVELFLKHQLSQDMVMEYLVLYDEFLETYHKVSKKKEGKKKRTSLNSVKVLKICTQINTELAQKYIRLCPDGMAYSDTILLVFIYFRHLVKEKPISINKRISGTSTINIMTAVTTIKEIFKMVILFNPLKTFAYPSILIIIISTIWGIPIILRGDGISIGTMLGIMTGFLLLVLGFVAEQISHIRRNQVE